MQTNVHTDEQTFKHIDKWTDRHTYRQMDRWPDLKTNRYTHYRQTDTYYIILVIKYYKVK